ncbi:MAG: 30S ribosomal protein S6 [Alphaproteobacteria bacterium]
MPLYEHIFMARQDISTQQVEALTETFKTIIEEGGGTIAKAEYWGLKPLSYKIKKNRKAHYSLFNIDAPHEAVAEMERQMGLSTDILRHLTLKVKAHEEEPSAMMRARGGRDDRRGRRPDFRRDERPRSDRPTGDRPTGDRPVGDRPKPTEAKPAAGEAPKSPESSAPKTSENDDKAKEASS